MVSTPTVSAATSEPCTARSARPIDESIRLSDSHTVTTSTPLTSQYQAGSLLGDQPNSEKAGTGMPSGPPVRSTSWFKTIEMMMPMPSVAMAR